jgi:hypothetical protein
VSVAATDDQIGDKLHGKERRNGPHGDRREVLDVKDVLSDLKYSYENNSKTQKPPADAFPPHGRVSRKCLIAA